MRINACDCGCDRLRLNISNTSAWISCMSCGAMGDDWSLDAGNDRSTASGAVDLWNKYPHTQHPAEALAARSAASPEALPHAERFAAARSSSLPIETEAKEP